MQVFCHFSATDAKRGDQSQSLSLSLSQSLSLSLSLRISVSARLAERLHSMYYLHLSELLRICDIAPKSKTHTATNETFEPWRLTTELRMMMKLTLTLALKMRASDDAANELLLDFQWHSKNMRHVTWFELKMLSQCALICQSSDKYLNISVRVRVRVRDEFEYIHICILYTYELL